MDPSRYFEGVIEIPAKRWTLSVEEFESGTPSRVVGDQKRRISMQEEVVKRCKGVAYIFNSCRYLKLSRSVALTAATLFHRYYVLYDMGSTHYYEIGATCVFIACKSEECRRKLSDVIKVCARMATGGREVIDEESKIYWHWKDLIVGLEEKVLEAFEFDVAPPNSYTVTAEALDVQLDQHMPVREGMDAEWLKNGPLLFGACVNVLELMARLPLVVMFPVEVICAVSMVYASKKTGIHVPPAVFGTKLGVEVADVVLCHETAIRFGAFTMQLDPQLQVALPGLSKADVEAVLR